MGLLANTHIISEEYYQPDGFDFMYIHKERKKAFMLQSCSKSSKRDITFNCLSAKYLYMHIKLNDLPVNNLQLEWGIL